jgi:hypothetical protein
LEEYPITRRETNSRQIIRESSSNQKSDGLTMIGTEIVTVFSLNVESSRLCLGPTRCGCIKAPRMKLEWTLPNYPRTNCSTKLDAWLILVKKTRCHFYPSKCLSMLIIHRTRYPPFIFVSTYCFQTYIFYYPHLILSADPDSSRTFSSCFRWQPRRKKFFHSCRILYWREYRSRRWRQWPDESWSSFHRS